MRILIAGGAGYIGSVLSRALVADGHDVTVADLFWFGEHAVPSEARRVRVDSAQLDASALGGYEQVIFLGGLSNDPMADYDPYRNFLHNTIAPTHLAYQARRAGVRRIIFGSSCSVYGFAPEREMKEGDATRSITPYGIAKLQAEQGIRQLQCDSFSTIIFRQGTVGGHSPRMRFDLVVNAMVKTAATESRIIVDNAEIWRPLLHIQDAANAYRKAVQADYSVCGVFNIASVNARIGDVAADVAAELSRHGVSDIAVRRDSRPDCRSYRVSWDHARQALDFSPQYSIADMARDVWQNREAYGNYSDDRFYNIRVFRKLHERGAL